ncbi:MAG: hypothetical protein ABEI77_06070 [Halorientalis sp.]
MSALIDAVPVVSAARSCVGTSMPDAVSATPVAVGGSDSATDSSGEAQTARQQSNGRGHSAANTAINVTSTELLESGNGCGVSVTVTNNGSTALSTNETDSPVDGTSQSDWNGAATVAATGDTHIWVPGQALSIDLTAGKTTPPSRVTVVTGSGGAATAFPTGDVTC